MIETVFNTNEKSFYAPKIKARVDYNEQETIAITVDSLALFITQSMCRVKPIVYQCQLWTAPYWQAGIPVQCYWGIHIVISFRSIPMRALMSATQANVQLYLLSIILSPTISAPTERPGTT